MASKKKKEKIKNLIEKTINNLDKTVVEGKTDDQIAVDAIVWYINEVVTDDIISYLNDNFQCK